MQTLTIKLKNAKALAILENLEALDVIEVIKKSVVKSKRKKLSERLAGSVTSEEAEQMRSELWEMRNGTTHADEFKPNSAILRELFLNGPVFTNEQIKVIEEARKAINVWRTK